MTDPLGSEWLRARRAELVDDRTLRGRPFGAALSVAVDEVLEGVLERVGSDRVAVLAMGSYARRELAPGSDLDILLLHDRRTDVASVADALWYPLWDAGFVIGHAMRTPKETRKLAGEDRDTLTALLDARIVGGDLDRHAGRLVEDAQALAHRHRDRLIGSLADAAAGRRVHPGPVADMLEPNLKEGAGGLRDLQAFAWVGWALEPGGGVEPLVARGALRPDDAGFFAAATTTLLDVRLALHRVTGGRSDVLALQDQDAVAAALEFPDADALVRDLAASSRRIAWIAEDAWAHLRPGRARTLVRDHVQQLPAGMVETAGRVGAADDFAIDDTSVLRVARVAAERRVGIDRATLARLRSAPPPDWNPDARADFFALLRQGSGAIEVFEALDHEDLVTRVLPEWETVRFLPQRNAYHRFMVDRHLLETVSEAARLLDEPTAPDARAAQSIADPDLLLLGALLHDIGKGQPGDHAVTGANAARCIGERLGLPADLIETLVWLVRWHLLMADTATRRDLSDPATIRRFAGRVGDVERLRLLTLLTVADSRATGPSAWGSGKAALVRELYDRSLPALTHPDLDVAERTLELPTDELIGPGVIVQWETLDDARLRCTVGAPDRPGLLAGVAGALAIEGFDIVSADGQTLPDGRAAEMFVGTDRFDRLGDDTGRDRAALTIQGVLTGRISAAEAIQARRSTYGQPAVATADERVRVRVAQDESDDATVVEVYAPDEIGLLATIASVFTEQALDVRVARVATTGEQAVDVFYVHEAGEKVTNPARVERLRTALFDSLRRD